MERTAKSRKPEFIYGIGDNFYFWGVENVYDVMWTKTFENVYQSEEMYVDWYFTTGNHDWDDGNGTAQIAYSWAPNLLLFFSNQNRIIIFEILTKISFYRVTTF